MENSINILKPSGCFEIKKIIGISTIHGNLRLYQVEWTPSWISGAHLIGCEQLIEQFEEEQKENDANPDIRGSSVTDEEVVIIDNILQKNSAAGLQIKREREIEVGACTYTDSTFSPIPINHQDVVELKQIVEGNADRSSVHHDSEGTNMDIENIQEDEEVDQKGSLTKQFVIVNNHDTELVRSPLQDVQNSHDDDRSKINNPGILFGRNRVKTSNQNNGNNVNIRLRNLRVSSIDKSNLGGKSMERGDGETKMFQCNICNKVFSNSVALKEHRKLHKRIHQCLKEHRKLHKYIHQCLTCFKSFAYKKTFQKHQLICIEHLGENNSPEKLRYQCIICCKTCGSKYKLNLHNIKMHSACDICNKTFNYTDMKKLKLHIETHKTVKTDPRECSYCEKRFLSKEQLTNHERVHTGERPYNCEICHKGFKTHSHYKVHLKVHERKAT